MYGVSLTDNLWPLKGDLRNVRDIVLFGHKYEIAHIESAVCEVITSHLDVEAMELEAQDVTDFYNEVTQAYAVQDAIFQILLRFQKIYGLSIMESLPDM